MTNSAMLALVGVVAGLFGLACLCMCLSVLEGAVFRLRWFWQNRVRPVVPSRSCIDCVSKTHTERRLHAPHDL
jgi:hypothetical protein